jgi:hypothetical protein
MTALQRWLLHVSTLLLAASGVAHAIMKYLLEGDDPYSAVGHPLQPWALSLHVVVAPLAVFAIGLIFRDHVVGGLRNRNGGAGKGSGLWALALLLPLAASGTLIQVVTNEWLRKALVVTHLSTGLLYTATYAAHLVRSRRGKRDLSLAGGSLVSVPLGTQGSIGHTAARRPR